jgi:hypothetical protein
VSDFYEDDEPVAEVVAAFERGQQFRTAPPTVRPIVRLIGGPGGDRTIPATRLKGLSPSQTICTRRGTEPWQHYCHDDADRYRYAGPCVEFHEPPADLECCCGRPGCDGTGPWPDSVGRSA